MKTFFKFLVLTPLVLIAVLASYIVVPIAVMFADKGGRLPKIFQWWETHDDLGWGAGVYEPAVAKVYLKYGKRIALIYWLYRNKAYTLRNKIRATPNYDSMTVYSKGADIPPKFGPFYSVYVISDKGETWFDFYLGFAFVKFYLNLRMGWKVKPIVLGARPDANSASGMFVGVALRSDDWDDFPQSKQ